MPHATMVNGDGPVRRGSSQFLSHLTSYPVVSDGISTFKEHPYGRKSIDFADGMYARFGKPVEPYVDTYVVPPYERFAAAYVARADELADSGLDRVDSHFPIVKEDTGKLFGYGKSLVLLPFRVFDEGRTYVFSTYNDEYEKTASQNGRGPGLLTSVLALISTEIKMAGDLIVRVAEFVGPTYEAGKSNLAERAGSLRARADSYISSSDAFRKDVERTAASYVRAGQERADAYARAARETADAWRRKGEHKATEGKQKAQETVDEVQQ